MEHRTLHSVKSYLAFILVLFSPNTWALAALPSPLRLENLDLLHLVALALIVILPIALAVSKIKVVKQRKQIEQAELDGQIIQAQLDHSVNGILQLNSAGETMYANQQAASFLQKKREQLIGTSIFDVCPASIKEELKAALEQKNNKGLSLEFAAGFHKRFCRLRVAHYDKALGQITTALFIDDIHTYHQQIDRVINQHNAHTLAVNHANVAIAVLDFASESAAVNGPLANLLKRDDDADLSLEALAANIEESDKLTWQSTLKGLKKGQPQRQQIKLQVQGQTIPVTVHSAPHSKEDKETPTQALVVFSNDARTEQLKQQISGLQQQTQAFVKTCPMPAYVLDTEHRITDANTPFCRLFGIEFRSIKGRPIEEIDGLDDYFRSLHAKGKVSTGTNKSMLLTLKDGETLDIDLHLTPYYQGLKRAGTVAVIQDLTVSKSLQSDSEHLRKRLNGVMNESPMGIALIDNEDAITSINQTLADLLKVNPEDLDKQTFHKLFSTAEQAGKVASKLHKTGKVERVKAELLNSDGTPFSAYVQISKLSALADEYVCWVSNDKAEYLLQDRLDNLVNYSNMPVAFVDDKGFTQLNPAACAFFNIKNQHDLIGTLPYAPELNKTSDHVEELTSHFEQVKNDRQVLEFPWVHKHDGETLPCEMTLVPLYDGDVYLTTLCMWVDLRAINVANKARLEAVKLREAAEKEIAEQQKRLQDSQELLASRALSLRNTQDKLLEAENDLAQKVQTINTLQQSNQDIQSHLQELETDYERNRALLEQSEAANKELEDQLQLSSDKVEQLQRQREQIADSLKFSELKHEEAREKLFASEQATELLKEEQSKHLASLQSSQQHIDQLKQSIEQKDTQIHQVSEKIHLLQSQLSQSGQATEALREQLKNQRNASEQAEQQRRELEASCQQAQAELSNKSSYVEHLHTELEKLEQLSLQQKEDIGKQTQALEQELISKQQQLEQTEARLTQAKDLSAQEKAQRSAQEQELARLKQELQDAEARSAQQYTHIAETNEVWKQQQADLQQELEQKQTELKATRQQLENTQQQTQEDKQRHTARLQELEAELLDVEQRAISQDEKMASNDETWQQQQQALADELAAKKAELEQTQQALDAKQRQACEEKLNRQAQEQKLVKLKVELADVQSRAYRQREILAGTDEQWQQQKAEIEAQKAQLQHALEHVESQNQNIQATLKDKLEELRHAESVVAETKEDEQQLIDALNAANDKADGLLKKLMQQEDQEQRLARQVNEQQITLQQKEHSIQSLQDEQARLTLALETVKQEQSQSQSALDNQTQGQKALKDQLKALERELTQSKQQLEDKESALNEAQQHLAQSAQKLEQQEQALINTQKEELQQQSGENPADKLPEFAQVSMPEEPSQWFDLLPYLQRQKGMTSMASTLKQLVNSLTNSIVAFDQAVAEDNVKDIHLCTRKLVIVLDNIDSELLQDMAKSLKMWTDNLMTDNISINWPSSKGKLLVVLRVIFSHLETEGLGDFKRA